MKQHVFRFFILLILFSCKTTNSRSSLRHTEDEPVRSSHPYRWTKVNEQTLLKFLGQGEGESSRLFPEASPMKLRLQKWVDVIDGTIRMNHPVELRDVPRPNLRIFASSLSNAGVGRFALCFENVKWQFGKAVQGESGISDFYANYDGLSLEFNFGDCAQKVKATESDLKSYIAEMNSMNGYRCRLDLKKTTTGDFEIIPDAACNADVILRSLVDDGIQPNFAVKSSGSDFIVWSSILNGITEERMVAVIAHELGHYYRAHASWPFDEYLFKLSDRRDPGKPEKPADLVALNESFLQARRQKIFLDKEEDTVRSQIPTSIYQYSGELRIHPQYQPLLASLVDNLESFSCKDTMLQTSCQLCRASKEVKNKSIELSHKLGKPYGLAGNIADSEVSTLAAWEDSALKCISRFDGYVSIEELESKKIVDGLSLMSIGSNLYVDSRVAFNIGANLGDRLAKASESFKFNGPPFNDEEFKKLPDILKIAASRLSEKRRVEETLAGATAKMEAMGLGIYTAEQEADEFAIEVLYKIGISPKVAGDMILSLSSPTDTKKFEQCLQFRKQDWKGLDGAQALIPWGTLNDPHPDKCFRAMNYDQEAKIHGYENIKNPAVFEKLPSWDSLVKEAKAEAKRLGVAL